MQYVSDQLMFRHLLRAGVKVEVGNFSQLFPAKRPKPNSTFRIRTCPEFKKGEKVAECECWEGNGEKWPTDRPTTYT